MFQSTWRLLLLGTLVVAVLMTAVPQADAYWGWGRYRAAYWGCGPYYGSYYSCYTPCYVSRCYPARWQYGCCGWSSGCWTSCACDPCCTSAPVCGATATPTPAEPAPAQPTPAQPPPAMPPEPAAVQPPPAVPMDAAPVMPSVEPPALPAWQGEPSLDPAAAPASPDTNRVNTAANGGLLTVWVPYDAKVTINGLATRSTGSRRQFVSHGLKSGFTYTYEVVAEVVRDGRVVKDSRTVTLTAGERTAAAFGFNPAPSESLAAR